MEDRQLVGKAGVLAQQGCFQAKEEHKPMKLHHAQMLVAHINQHLMAILSSMHLSLHFILTNFLLSTRVVLCGTA